MAVTNFGFSNGCHTWQVFCPIRCQKVQMGVVEVSESGIVSSKFNVYSFKTTTRRLVTLKLDCHGKKLNVWLNGRAKPKKTLSLSEDAHQWYPCVRLAGEGNVAVLNPFVVDPEQPKNSYMG